VGVLYGRALFVVFVLLSILSHAEAWLRSRSLGRCHSPSLNYLG
jgi:hypothetical protein